MLKSGDILDLGLLNTKMLIKKVASETDGQSFEMELQVGAQTGYRSHKPLSTTTPRTCDNLTLDLSTWYRITEYGRQVLVAGPQIKRR
jgi:hypothetical protein